MQAKANLLSPDVFSSSKCTKTHFDAPPDPLGVGCGGDTPPHSPPPRCLRRLNLGACGASLVSPFPNKFLPTPLVAYSAPMSLIRSLRSADVYNLHDQPFRGHGLHVMGDSLPQSDRG